MTTLDRLALVLTLAIGLVLLLVPRPRVRRTYPRVDLRAHSPTTPLAFLEEWEWQLWTSVIEERTR